MRNSDRDAHDRDITLDEVLSAIKSFANDKSPSCDGSTAEFYQTFFSFLLEEGGVIGNDLVDVINYVFLNEKVTSWCNHFNLEGKEN